MKTRALALALAAATLSGCLHRVAWLPDGRRLVYVQETVVWLITLEGTRTKLAEIPGLEEATVAAAPAGGLIAVAGKTRAGCRLAVWDESGTSKWSGTVPGEEAVLLPGCWSPDGSRMVVTMPNAAVFLADLTSGRGTTVTGGAAARFAASGDLIGLSVAKDAAKLTRRAPGGATTSATWKLPAGVEEPDPQILTGDATAAWWKGKRGNQEIVVLAGADGRILFSSTRTMAAAGPDDRSYVTAEGGYALINGRDGKAANLNPVYNALLRMDLNWQLADPAAAAEAYDAGALLKSCLPAFSPDGTKAAILTPHLLCVATLKTSEVAAIAKW